MFMKTVKSTERIQQHQVEKFINEYLVEYYPKSIKWYNEKVIPNIEKSHIVIITSDDENFSNITGIMILKVPETKICTIYVNAEYRHSGIGTLLLQNAFNKLNTNKPFITMPNQCVSNFNTIISKYNWELRGMYPNLYKSGITELSYNGNLY